MGSLEQAANASMANRHKYFISSPWTLEGQIVVWNRHPGARWDIHRLRLTWRRSRRLLSLCSQMLSLCLGVQELDLRGDSVRGQGVMAKGARVTYQ